MKQRWRIDATPQSMSTQLQTYDKVTKKKISYVKVANTESISVSKHLPLPLSNIDPLSSSNHIPGLKTLL